jgi:hypothetical protein
MEKAQTRIVVYTKRKCSGQLNAHNDREMCADFNATRKYVTESSGQLLNYRECVHQIALNYRTSLCVIFVKFISDIGI